MLSHPAAMGIRTVRGAALFIMRCRAMLAADQNESGNEGAAENVMLMRDNLLEIWGEPVRADALEAIAWLGSEWAVIGRITLRESENDRELEVEASKDRRRVLACRAIWQAMNPTPEEREHVKQWLARLTAGSWR